MSIDFWWPITMFAFVSSITPGPNNMMLLASGVNFGVRKSIPHMLGISIGFFVLLMAVGFGLGQVFSQWPWLYSAMKWIGAMYMLWLSWKIATAPAPSADTIENCDAHKPMTFIGAALFQWINPKAWVMAVSVFSTYAPNDRSLIVPIGLIFAAINLPSVGAWVFGGVQLRSLLKFPNRVKRFNQSMGLILAASLIPSFFAL